MGKEGKRYVDKVGRGKVELGREKERWERLGSGKGSGN